MAPSKYELDKVDGSGDFSLWQKKMTAILVQNQCSEALDESLVTEKDKVEPPSYP